MEIRHYCEEYEDEIKAVIEKAISSVKPEKYSAHQQKHLENIIPEMNIEFAKKDRYVYFLAIKNDELIGVAGFQKESGTISGIFVDPDYMEKGIGTKLLNRLEQEARKEGLTKLKSPSSLEAVKFYRKNGYNVIGEREQNMKGLTISVKVMIKNLG